MCVKGRGKEKPRLQKAEEKFEYDDLIESLVYVCGIFGGEENLIESALQEYCKAKGYDDYNEFFNYVLDQRIEKENQPRKKRFTGRIFRNYIKFINQVIRRFPFLEQFLLC